MPRASSTGKHGVAEPQIRLTIGQRLEVGYDPSSPLARTTDTTDWLATRLEDVADDRSWLTVAWPTDSERRLILVECGDGLAVAVTTPQDALYAADVVVAATVAAPVP